MSIKFKTSTQPKWTAPMLATLSDTPFSDPNWIFERKLDGMRCILHKKGDVVNIWSRNKIKQNNVFPELVAALRQYPSNFILDCEVVAFEGNKTSFEKIALRMHVQNPAPKLIRQVPIVAYVFDLLYLNNYNLSSLPLMIRKKILQENFKFTKPLKYLNHCVANGLKLYAAAETKGWEGIIAKQADSPYIHRRSKAWLKLKCDQGQEFVIAGYTPPQGQRIKFGALLLGYYKNKSLHYAGKVGTGFDVKTLIAIETKMRSLQIKKCPFVDYGDRSSNVTWVKPKLVAELGFTEWTADGHLRHPRFLGLRTDKAASQIRREG
jgi:bifunctional non-homologous end joining protein LigD